MIQAVRALDTLQLVTHSEVDVALGDVRQQLLAACRIIYPAAAANFAPVDAACAEVDVNRCKPCVG